MLQIARESRSECLQLMKIWDTQGLLTLFEGPVGDGMFCRVFNCFKSAECDRQIGDRSRINMSEFSYDGPSKFLPPGPVLTQLRVARLSQKLVASVTDRRDFYHQAAVSLQRAQTNLLPFPFEPSELAGLRALEEFVGRNSKTTLGDREMVGFAAGPRSRCTSPKPLFGGFASLFQGDHLGVEFALCAHQCLLEDEGLLSEEHQVRGHWPFPKGPKYSGVVIDDYFVIGREGASVSADETEALRSCRGLVRSIIVSACWARRRKTLRHLIASKQQALRLCPMLLR